MSYRFEAGEPITVAFRRVADEELGAALEQLGSVEGGLDRRVHEVRKHLKKLRALFELARGSIDPDALDGAAGSVRRAAHTLAPIRGQGALMESFEALNRRAGGELTPDTVARVRSLLAPHDGAGPSSEAALGEARAILTETRARLVELEPEKSGWPALGRGFRGTYGRARKAYRRAREELAAETLHEFRTPAKRHYYQVQLLEGCWPEFLRAHRRELDKLGEILGKHHDLSLLAEKLHAALGAAAEPVEVLIARRASELETRSIDLGARLFSEQPRALARRFRAYFEAQAAPS